MRTKKIKVIPNSGVRRTLADSDLVTDAVRCAQAHIDVADAKLRGKDALILNGRFRMRVFRITDVSFSDGKLFINGRVKRSIGPGYLEDVLGYNPRDLELIDAA